MNLAVHRRTWLGLARWLALCYGGALVASQFTPGVWYQQLAKPDWTPPDWVFSPVWTIFYGLMAVAAWLVWKDRGFSGARVSLGAFIFQLILNITWSYLFFGLQRPDLALVDIGLLWLAIAVTLVTFWRESVLAGSLLVPYLLWVTFAAALNLAIWRLN